MLDSCRENVRESLRESGNIGSVFGAGAVLQRAGGKLKKRFYDFASSSWCSVKPTRRPLAAAIPPHAKISNIFG